jgi:Tfp pilus assembly protein PilO
MEIKNRQKLLLIGAGICVVLLMGDSFVLSPLIASWKDREKTIQDLRTKVGDGTNLLNRAAAINRRWDRMQTNTLPSNVSQAEAEMLKSFDRWERDTGITRVSFKPQWKQSDEDYATLECRADYTGDIDRLKRFLYEVEHDPLGLKVQAVEISSRDDAGQQLTMGLEVSGLLLNPTPETLDQ